MIREFLIAGALAATVTCSRTSVSAQEAATGVARPAARATGTHHGMHEDVDGTLKKDEYVVISMNGSITRALCPYTCEMRGLPREKCREWQSVNDPSKCYVQDTTLPSDAVPFEGDGATAAASH